VWITYTETYRSPHGTHPRTEVIVLGLLQLKEG
jgi:hypothetical protein